MMTATAPGFATCDRLPLTNLFSQGRDALDACLERPNDDAAWISLLAVRREIATEISQLPVAQKSGPALDSVRTFLKAVADSGALDRSVGSEELELAESLQARGWPGLLGTMVLVPAWQWPGAPKLEKVPSWLWADYTPYLFYAPQGFTDVGQADKYAAHYLGRLGELARVATANRGSSSVRAALTAYVRVGSCIPLYFANESLRKHYELRGRILTAASGVGRQDRPEPMPRSGRRLRVGFVNRHFGPQTETYTTLPMFEQLDPERFEVLLFVHHRTAAAVETHAAGRVAELRELTGDLSAQVEQLHAADLDVVVFGTNLTAVCNEVTLLALHRVAPLQVVNNSSCTTTGLLEVDLYVSGTMTESAGAPEHFSERLGLVPGPAHAFNYDTDRAEPTTTWTREALGIPGDAVVFVSAANYFKIIPEMRQAWAKLLAAVPGSRLLLHPFNPNWSSSYPIRRFQTEMERVLAEHGVDASRLVISTNRFPSRSDVKTLLGVGDIYLDTFPFGGVNSLVDPLELGMPVVVWEGETFRSRMGGALLRSLEMPELIATNQADYQAIAVKLATDREQHTACATRIREKMERMPVFLDTLAASEAFGNLIETAFDELVTVGWEAFRANRTPLRGTAQPADAVDSSTPVARARAALCESPADPAARHAIGCALLDSGFTGRAVTYLLAALQHDERNGRLWFDTARALRTEGRASEAVQALESSLRLDPSLLDGWILFAELAREVGLADLAAEAAGVARELAPGDPRLAVLT